MALVIASKMDQKLALEINLDTLISILTEYQELKHPSKKTSEDSKLNASLTPAEREAEIKRRYAEKMKNRRSTNGK